MMFENRASLAPFEERPLWLSVQLGVLDSLIGAFRLKQAQKMDKWTPYQSELVRWLSEEKS